MNSWNRQTSVIPIRSTPSLLYKNLSYCQDKLVVAHGSEVALSCLTGATIESKKLHLKNHAVIFQVTWATCNDKKYLMIATTEGFELWDADCQRMLHLYSLGDDDESSSGTKAVGRKNILFTHSRRSSLLSRPCFYRLGESIS